MNAITLGAYADAERLDRLYSDWALFGYWDDPEVLKAAEEVKILEADLHGLERQLVEAAGSLDAARRLRRRMRHYRFVRDLAEQLEDHEGDLTNLPAVERLVLQRLVLVRRLGTARRRLTYANRSATSQPDPEAYAAWARRALESPEEGESISRASPWTSSVDEQWPSAEGQVLSSGDGFPADPMTARRVVQRWRVRRWVRDRATAAWTEWPMGASPARVPYADPIVVVEAAWTEGRGNEPRVRSRQARYLFSKPEPQPNVRPGTCSTCSKSVGAKRGWLLDGTTLEPLWSRYGRRAERKFAVSCVNCAISHWPWLEKYRTSREVQAGGGVRGRLREDRYTSEKRRRGKRYWNRLNGWTRKHLGKAAKDLSPRERRRARWVIDRVFLADDVENAARAATDGMQKRDLQVHAERLRSCCELWLTRVVRVGDDERTTRIPVSACGLRTCPTCMGLQAEERGDDVTERLLELGLLPAYRDEQGRYIGGNLSSWTLTLRNVSKIDIDQWRWLQRRFGLAFLAMRAIFPAVQAAFYGLEATHKTAESPWHPHVHALVHDDETTTHADLMSMWALVSEGKGLFVDVSTVRARRPEPDRTDRKAHERWLRTELRSAVNEVTRYTLKGTDCEDPRAVVELEKSTYWRDVKGRRHGIHMTEFVGSWRGSPLRVRATEHFVEPLKASVRRCDQNLQTAVLDVLRGAEKALDVSYERSLHRGVVEHLRAGVQQLARGGVELFGAWAAAWPVRIPKLAAVVRSARATGWVTAIFSRWGERFNERRRSGCDVRSAMIYALSEPPDESEAVEVALYLERATPVRQIEYVTDLNASWSQITGTLHQLRGTRGMEWIADQKRRARDRVA